MKKTAWSRAGFFTRPCTAETSPIGRPALIWMLPGEVLGSERRNRSTPSPLTSGGNTIQRLRKNFNETSMRESDSILKTLTNAQDGAFDLVKKRVKPLLRLRVVSESYTRLYRGGERVDQSRHSHARFKFLVLAFKFPALSQKFPAPLSREFFSKSTESLDE